MADCLPDGKQCHQNNETVPDAYRGDTNPDECAGGDQQDDGGLIGGDGATAEGVRADAYRTGRGSDERAAPSRRCISRTVHGFILLLVVVRRCLRDPAIENACLYI